jgi:hypothetical protein
MKISKEQIATGLLVVYFLAVLIIAVYISN